MSDLEARQLRYYVAVAEELHFGRAALRLGIAQPSLSRVIRDLERDLGVRLLERTTHHVSLTAAGDVLLREARVVLGAGVVAARRVQEAGHPTLNLRLALKADHDGGLLPQILEAYRTEGGTLPVELVLGGRGEQAPALREGRADVGLTMGPFDHEQLDVEPLLTEPRLVALAADDPLAPRSFLRLADLAGKTLPDGIPAETGGFATATSHGHRVHGPWPLTTPPTPVGQHHARPLDLAQIFSLIELGSIVWFPPASLTYRHRRPGIAYRTVVDLAPTTLSVAWPQTSRSAAVAAFVRAAVAVAGSAGDSKEDSERSAASADEQLAVPQR